MSETVVRANPNRIFCWPSTYPVPTRGKRAVLPFFESVYHERLPGLAERLFWLNMCKVIHLDASRSWRARTAKHTFSDDYRALFAPHTLSQALGGR
jgi:hypothetical protein